MKITLKKLISRKEVFQIIKDMMNYQGLPCCIKDIDGMVLAGNNDSNEDVKHEIKIEDKLLGYVVGDHRSVLMVSFIDYLIKNEFERRSLANETLEKYRQISLLFDIAETINSAQDLGKTANLILKGAQKLIESSSGSIMLLNNGNNMLEAIASFGEEHDYKAKIPHDEGIAGIVLKSGKVETVNVNDVSSDPRFLIGNEMISGLLCAPLKINNKVIGVFNMRRIESKIYTAEDMKIFSIVSSQAAAALENAIWHQYKEDTDKIQNNLSQYVSPQILRTIKGNVSLKPTREHVAIVFADIRNFSGICEQLPPESIVTYLNEYFRHMVEIISKNGGMVNKFVGDMVVSIFGAPDKYVDSEKRAVETAINMQQRIDSIDTEFIRDRFAIGIGISSGDVIVGNIGSPMHMDYTAIGDEVNVAERLQSIAKAGQILATRSVYEKTKHTFSFRGYQSINVKGKKKPVEVFEVKY
ncbi:MAG: GAF domain-containing protein [Nitrospirae bacterium]|nr:GAF domain-containing protein [Nitrospirota bacterium]